MLDLKAATGIQYVTKYAVDADKLIEGSMTIDRVSQKIISQTFSDYNNKKAYKVDMYGDQSGSCQSAPTSHEFYNTCNSTHIDSYMYVGNATLGGPTGIMYDGWRINYKDGLN